MREIRELVAQLTLEEKASLCSGKDFWHLKAIERLGIPSVMVSDGPHGLRKQDDKADHLGINDSIQAVCFPAACATACSFDPDLLYQMGSALGEECRAEGVSVLLGPAVNIKRSPLCGRNFEYFSEDPFLAGKLSAAQIQGVQQWNVGTSLKHFAANNQEYRRMSASSQVDERTLREIYLTAFEIAVKEAKPWTVMCSYNRLNGEYASESKKLLSDILREDWGFDGVVVSDWGAVNRRVEGLAAGLDLEMPASGGSNDAKLVAAVNEGTLSEAVLDKAVSRILTMVFRYADAPEKPCVFDREAHHALAVSYEKESAVLLQNNGVLPLSRRKKLAYIGAYAQKPRYQGGGSSHINASKVTNALDSARAEGLDVVYAEGFPFDKDEADEQRFAQAVAAARAVEVAVIFAGLPDSFESEGYDRQHMRLPDCQYQLIERIAAVQPNTVVVLHNGSPVELPFAEDVAAILELYLGGQGVGEATHALLFGDANPCGRLAETFPQKLSDNPSYLNFPGDGNQVTYAEGVYVGYRYYDTKEMPVRYPFGHGLSYTEYRYTNPKLSAPCLEDSGTVTVSVEVENTGKLPGKETVQLYVKPCPSLTGRPVKELKGFCKVSLAPGERKTVTIPLTARSLARYCVELCDWYAPSGTYTLLLGHSSADIRAELPLAFTTAKVLPLVVTENTTVGELLDNPITEPVVTAQIADYLSKNAAQSNDTAKAAISDEMSKQMLLSTPLRALRSFAAIDDNTLNTMVAFLNLLLGSKL